MLYYVLDELSCTLSLSVAYNAVNGQVVLLLLKMIFI